MSRFVKRLIAIALFGGYGLGSASAAVINLSTGVANWQVQLLDGSVVAATAVSRNEQWAPAPAGSSWISYGFLESTSCVPAQTPGSGCAHALADPVNSDLWLYSLRLSAASLGATAGSLNFIFGADNRVDLFVGLTPTGLNWGGSGPTGNGFDPLGCSATPPTSAGDTQASYNLCTTTVAFDASRLDADGSLTLFARVRNDPIVDCSECGNPTGFVLEGALLTGGAIVRPTPEPETIALMLGGLGAAFARRRRPS